jgi:signal transduction histidine kinase
MKSSAAHINSPPAPASVSAGPNVRALAHPTLLIVIPLLVLLIGVLVSVVIYRELRGRADLAWREVAQNQTATLDNAFADMLRAELVPLRTMTGLFLGSENVTADEFERVIRSIPASDGSDGRIALGYVAPNGQGGYTLAMGVGFDATAGNDALDWPGLPAALQAARANPLQIKLSPAPLFADNVGNHFAFVLALDGSAETGVLVAPVDLTRLTSRFVAERVPSGLALELAHRAMGAAETWPLAPGGLHPDGLATDAAHITGSVTVGGAEWNLTWHVAGDFRGGPDQSFALAVLVGSLGASFLAALLFLLAIHRIRHERAETDTARHSAELFRQHALQLAIARDNAEQANRAKSQFLANMSHELRTPLNAIVGFSDMMRLGLCGQMANPQQADCIQHISDSGAHLQHLISDLLDTVRIESGQMEMSEEPHDSVAIAREAATLLQPTAAKKSIRLAMETGDNLPHWHVDRRAALQILSNLLSNAIKFSPVHSAVVIKIERLDDGGLGITISDQGPGIPPGMQAQIFERFARGDPAVSRKQEGLGLGLWIVRNLVELHRGEITIDSALGGGTAVRLYFPPARFDGAMASTGTLG